MSRSEALLRALDRASDWLSPVVVKEVRQVVRGREFVYSFAASLIVGLAIAFFGAADALRGTGTSGAWTFRALMAYLTLLGLVVVPLTAFSAMRVERAEQTLELITLTALTPRRVVIGKLLAQGVKLATLFAAVGPFIAMTFLLGGIDFVTILVSITVLFMWSLWASAACLFISSLFKTRAVLGLALGGVGLLVLASFGLGRLVYLLLGRSVVGTVSVGFGTAPSTAAASAFWWSLAILTTFCIVTMVNLVLLAENRLSLPTENRVTALRLGFLVQFLLVVGWTLTFIGEPPPAPGNALDMLRIFGGLQIAVVALFAVTEDFGVPRRVALRLPQAPARRWLLAMFLPGGGRGAVFVLAQMTMLYFAALLFRPDSTQLSWIVAMCGYICFFTGIPTLALRTLREDRVTSLQLRFAALVLLLLALVLPDLLHYVLWRPDVLDLGFSRRHLINPFRTLANWWRVYAPFGLSLPFGLGLAGLLAYAALIRLDMNASAQAATVDERGAAQAAEEPRNVNILY